MAAPIQYVCKIVILKLKIHYYLLVYTVLETLHFLLRLDNNTMLTMLIEMKNKIEQQDARLTLQDDLINDLRKGKYRILNIEI